MVLSLAAALAMVLVMSAPAWAAQQVITSPGPLDRIALSDTLGAR